MKKEYVYFLTTTMGLEGDWHYFFRYVFKRSSVYNTKTHDFCYGLFLPTLDGSIIVLEFTHTPTSFTVEVGNPSQTWTFTEGDFNREKLQECIDTINAMKK
jgi:hypothetical protein